MHCAFISRLESIIESSAEILFDRLMLLELRGNVTRLDPKCYAELKSYNDPPATIANIMKSVLAMFYTEKALEGEFDSWTNCRQVHCIFSFRNLLFYCVRVILLNSRWVSYDGVAFST